MEDKLIDILQNFQNDKSYTELDAIDDILRLSNVVGQSEQLLDFIQWRKQVAVDDLADKEIVQFYLARKVKQHNGVHMACGGFEALSCPPKPKLATERKTLLIAVHLP